MRKLPSWVPSYAVVAAAFAVLLAIGALREADSAGPASAAFHSEPHDTAGVLWSHGQDGAARNAQEHWRKHGSDFPEFHDAAEYERGALDFIRHPPPGTLVKRRANGDTLLYDPSTDTFAVEDREGEPRTFFRPGDGRRYWERQ